MFIDSHCHLDHLKLADYQKSLDAELDKARDAGVSGFLCIGIDYDQFDQLLDIENRHSDVWISIGEHPLNDSLGEQDSRLQDYCSHERVVAVGETGLDYHYAPEKAEVQKASFIRHLRVADELQKPVIVHSREAEQDTLDLIDSYCGPARGVLHCFTGSWSMASDALDRGFYISISGIATFANADELREVIKKIPLDRLLIETDSPWLAPAPYRGKPNTPVYLPEVAKVVSELQGVNLTRLAEATTQNFYNLFSKVSAVNK